MSGCRPEDGVPDMTVISDINEHGINKNLHTRYDRDQIYTYTGSILVAVNPYKELPFYNTSTVFAYHDAKLGSLEPHVFALAQAAYKALQSDRVNQSLVISGESGAGKTESTKFILEYLCSVTANISTWVQQQILEANTILEAFGNAKTIRNDNSSRFGRFMQVCFDNQFKIKGCVIQDYLLEQSRITFQSTQERNYHIFYQLTAAAQRDRNLAAQFQVRSPSEYFYLNQSGCTRLDGVDDAARFDSLRMAFSIVQIPADKIEAIFSVISAVLWLGNLQFQQDTEQSHNDSAMLTPDDKTTLETVSLLLGVDMETMVHVALVRQINISGNVTEIPLKYTEARENRHAMAKALYSRTFAWLVDHINKCTNPGTVMTQFIGILDIFGFENFATNSFEQLCINYTNEKLHMFFNHYVFKIEQEIYRAEEIKFSHITFTDNTSCLELIEKPPRCILKLLSEQCHMPGGSDAGYLNNLHTEFDSHPDFCKGEDRRRWDKEFGVRHYAGVVNYNVKGFVEKNKDSQQDVFFDILFKSKTVFVQELCEFKDLLSKVATLGDVKGDNSFSKGTAKRMTNRAKPTVSDAFRLQLQVLVNVLEETNPWYVRCIKPNMTKAAGIYDDKLVLDQLKYLGMLEIIRIRKQGFAVHYLFSDFLSRYTCIIGASRYRLPKDVKEAVRQVCRQEGLSQTEWQIGKTKVFLRSCIHEPLEEKRLRKLNTSAVVIQKHWKGYRQRREYLRIWKATRRIQEYWLSRKFRIAFIRKRRAAVVIQSHLRGFFAREVATALREAKRVEEERRRQERIEEERRLRKIEEEKSMQEDMANNIQEDPMTRSMAKRTNSFSGLADVDSIDAEEELNKLTQLAGKINSQITQEEFEKTSENVDLDQLFNFLSREIPDSLHSESIRSGSVAGSSEAPERISILDEIDKQMSDLQNEIDRYSLQGQDSISACDETTTGTYNSSDSPTDNIPTPPPPPEFDRDDSYSPPPLPPPEHSHGMQLAKPSLPEPEGPPPPPPVQNGYAFSNSHFNQETKKIVAAKPINKAKEPIYESIKPRPEPVGGSGNTPPMSEYEMYKQKTQAESVVTNNVESSQYQAGEKRQTSVEESQSNQRKRSASNSPNRASAGSKPNSLSSSVYGALPQQEDPEREQRRLARVRRELEKIQEVEEDKANCSMEEEFHDMLEFAENFFNDHERSPTGTIVGTLKRSKTMEIMPKNEMIKFYKGNSIPCSHIHMYDPENVSMACNIFKDLAKYAKGDLKGESEVTVIQQIIQMGIEREELRDEIYVQCVRQLTNNPNTEQVERIWLLLCLIVVAFTTSKSLFKYFVSFLRQNLESEGKTQQFVQWCLDNSNRPIVAPRKLPPSSVEIAAMKRLGTIVCRFFFLDGRTKAIDVHPCDTAQDSLSKLADKIGLTSLDGWALYESGPQREEHIPGHHYLYDVISSWETEQTVTVKKDASQSKLSPAKAQPLKKKPMGGSDNRFIFKKRLFRNTREIPADPVEVSLLFAQAVHSVVRCDELPVSEKVGLQLAGLQAQVALGEPQPNRSELYQDIDMFLSQRIKTARFLADKEWVPILTEAHSHYGAGKAEVVAKVWYLSCVMQYPLYGCTMFPVNYRGYWSYGNNLILGVNATGVLLLKPDDKFILFEFPYKEIESILLDPSDNFVTVTLVKTEVEKQRVFVFETSQKVEVGALIASYFPQLANWIREADAPLRRVRQITNEDRLRLHHQLVNCRRSLVDNNILKKPLDDGKGFLKNTLRKLSAKKIDKLRAEALTNEQGEVYKGFCHTFWAFLRNPLLQTLTIMTEPDEQVAMQIFSLILTYAGLLQVVKEDGAPPKQDEEDHVILIQTVLDKAMKKDCLVNEVFLQLIKQTTDHPEPNSRVNLRHWSLLALACSIILPVDKLVRKYLLAHLKKCSADFVTEEGKYARFAERCYHKTLGTRRRQWPPSKQEILCTINRRPIYARFHFMDGQFHAVEFDPSATASEVLKLVMAKIGLRETAEGYAIYEVLGQQERSLLPDEKVADVMSKWEKYRAAGGTLSRQSRHHMFLFKKHLFLDEYIDLTDAVEKELLYYQVLCDLRSDRFPVTDMEAVMLCALRAQIELSDYSSGDGDYRQVMTHCLPPRLLANIQKDHVAMHHQSLLGMNIEEAKQAFLNLIQCWPLHKATLFDVTQSFTSNWPKTLWLAVDQRGVHLLEARSRNVLTTYEFEFILDYTPSISHMLLITGNDKKQSKIIVNTNQAFQISNLIREYIGVLQEEAVGKTLDAATPTGYTPKPGDLHAG